MSGFSRRAEPMSAWPAAGWPVATAWIPLSRSLCASDPSTSPASDGEHGQPRGDRGGPLQAGGRSAYPPGQDDAGNEQQVPPKAQPVEEQQCLAVEADAEELRGRAEAGVGQELAVDDLGLVVVALQREHGGRADQAGRHHEDQRQGDEGPADGRG